MIHIQRKSGKKANGGTVPAFRFRLKLDEYIEMNYDIDTKVKDGRWAYE